VFDACCHPVVPSGPRASYAATTAPPAQSGQFCRNYFAGTCTAPTCPNGHTHKCPVHNAPHNRFGCPDSRAAASPAHGGGNIGGATGGGYAGGKGPRAGWKAPKQGGV
jgi:hypothetical protein